MAKQARPKITTPKARAKWPKLTEPDTRFNPDGEYSVSLLFDPEEHAEFLEMLDEMANEAYENAVKELIEKGQKAKAKKVQKREPYSDEVNGDGEETGLVEVKFKMKAKTSKGKEMRPKLFDAKGVEIDPDDIDIWGGSILRVNFSPSQYYVPSIGAGVSLFLNAVQVIELSSGNGGNAESFGFGAEEGGYEVGSGSGDSDDEDEEEAQGDDTDEDEDDF